MPSGAANASRHRTTWAKNTARYKAAAAEHIEGLQREAADLQAAGYQQHGQRDLPEVGEGRDAGIVRDKARESLQLAEKNQGGQGR